MDARPARDQRATEYDIGQNARTRVRETRWQRTGRTDSLLIRHKSSALLLTNTLAAHSSLQETWTSEMLEKVSRPPLPLPSLCLLRNAECRSPRGEELVAAGVTVATLEPRLRKSGSCYCLPGLTLCPAPLPQPLQDSSCHRPQPAQPLPQGCREAIRY